MVWNNIKGIGIGERDIQVRHVQSGNRSCKQQIKISKIYPKSKGGRQVIL